MRFLQTGPHSPLQSKEHKQTRAHAHSQQDSLKRWDFKNDSNYMSESDDPTLQVIMAVHAKSRWNPVSVNGHLNKHSLTPSR